MPSSNLKLSQISVNAEAVLDNIEWNLGGLAGMAVITLRPEVLNTTQVPRTIKCEGLDLDGFQCLGLAMLEKDRMPRHAELLKMAKRSLICESVEVVTDALARSSRIVYTGVDPYEGNENFTANVKELWNKRDGRAGSLIHNTERRFFKDCVGPLRNCISHNNSRLPPNRSIKYSEKIRDQDIKINLIWEKDKENFIQLSLQTAHKIFRVIRATFLSGVSLAKDKQIEKHGKKGEWEE